MRHTRVWLQVRGDLGELDGVTTFCELAVPLTARLAERLGLPGNSPDAVDTARNKHAARAAMSAAKLPTPRNFLIEAKDQLADAAAAVGFPAVIKPVSGAASIGVIRVNDEAELQRNYATCAPLRVQQQQQQPVALAVRGYRGVTRRARAQGHLEPVRRARRGGRAGGGHGRGGRGARQRGRLDGLEHHHGGVPRRARG